MPFVNPYNFISLQPGNKQPLDFYIQKGETLTGKLACRLTARTELIIPDHEHRVVDGAGYKTQC